jgi:hypothetical protein
MKPHAIAALICICSITTSAIFTINAADAARNSGGTYALPAGNPVTSGTAISSVTHNNTMSDIATELTNSLDRGGRGAMTAGLPGYAGTVSLPGYTFSGATDNGLYLIGTDNVGMSINGVKTQEWSTSGSAFTKTVTIATASGYGLVITSTDGDAASFTGAASTAGIGVLATGGSSGGNAVRAIGGASGGAGIWASGTGAGSGGIFAGGTTGVGLSAQGGTGRAPIRIVTSTAPTTAVIGDLYVDAAGILYICTNATGPVFTKVGAQ